MRVLWFCNCPLNDADAGVTGTWLGAMARGLMDSDAVELGMIAFGPVKEFSRQDYRQVRQWIVPGGVALGRSGLPSASLIGAIVTAVEEFSPDLIHVWGTEDFWGLLAARGLVEYPSLLETQGLKSQIAKIYFGDLTLWERLRCIGIKELLKCRTLFADRRQFARWGLREAEIIRGHRFVDVQTPWLASHVEAINPAVRLFEIDFSLREAFCRGDGWEDAGQPTIFCTSSYSSPFKGLHVAVRALALLKRRIPGVRLRIAGAHQRRGFRQDGYMRWINRLIARLELADAITWLGPLSADQIVAELVRAGAAVIPTFIEGYCLALAEAMRVGTPTVAAYAGGTGHLGKDEETCLYYPPGDEAMCAHQLERVLTDRDLAQRLSRESRKIATVRNDRQRIVERQLEIYQRVLDEAEGHGGRDRALVEGLTP
jgi:glycosyltransferase involved in cell wall biosynthesis